MTYSGYLNDHPGALSFLARNAHWVAYAASGAGVAATWFAMANREAIQDLTPGSALQHTLNGAPHLEQVPAGNRYSYTSQIADPQLVPYRAVLSRSGATNAKSVVEVASELMWLFADELANDTRYAGQLGIATAVNGLLLLADIGWWMPSDYTNFVLEGHWYSDGVVPVSSMVMPASSLVDDLGDVNHVGQTSNDQFISAVENHLRRVAVGLPPAPPGPTPEPPPPPPDPWQPGGCDDPTAIVCSYAALSSVNDGAAAPLLASRGGKTTHKTSTGVFTSRSPLVARMSAPHRAVPRVPESGHTTP